MARDASGTRQLDRYVLHEEFASGGMASVHFGRLRAEAGFARTVAIKRLHPQHARDPAFVAMLLDEARLAARIRHPNVVPILDVIASPGDASSGEEPRSATSQREVLLVMEYVHGESLAELMLAARRSGVAIPARIASSVVSGALHGLAAAHAATSEEGAPLGIVHRDVSPENILVGADGVARVFDFGIALAVGRSQVTREGGLKGKLGYMAPELLEGQKATALSDVYSAGVVLWEVLVGRRLFTGEHEANLLGQILRHEVSRPSAHAALPAAVDDVVLRAMARSPADRYRTARDFAAALEATLPPATQHAVAAWVLEVAGSTLADRAELLAAAERAPLDGSALRTEAVARRPRPADDATTRRIPVDAADLVRTELLPASPNRPAPAPRRRRRAIAAIAVALALCGGAIALGVRAQDDAPSPPSPAPTLATAAPEPVASPDPTADPVLPSAVPDEPPAATPAPRAPAAPRARPSQSSRAGQPPPAARSCDPPYTIDERGIHHYKAGCL